MGKRKRNKGENRHRTPLSRHHRQGKQLNPPFVQFGLNKNLVSWMNDRLPEMVWAALLIAGLGREAALREFREYGRFVFKHANKESLFDPTLTGLSQLAENLRTEAIGCLCRSENNRSALAPLLLFDGLPARDVWSDKLQNQKSEADLLLEAVRLTLFHQSQEATDCRWIRLMCAVFGGRIIIPKEELLLLNAYPVKGDQTVVRPSIRAAEGLLDMGESRDKSWPQAFWRECWENTPCMVRVDDENAEFQRSTGVAELAALNGVRKQLTEHWENTHNTTGIDARHDAVFGIAFYAIRLAQEVLSMNKGETITGRLAVRTLIELRITLAYLLKEESDKLWREWRGYGAGQAKLTSLKLDESKNPQAGHLNADTLREIANEDFWEEMVPVDLGHWAGMDLRKLSEQIGLKDEYDRYYPWTSGFSHGQWGPIRESVFRTCLNPLHRGHRCPYTDAPESLPSVTNDVCELVNAILADLNWAYHEFPHRLPIKS